MVEARGHLDAPVYEEIEHTGKLQVGKLQVMQNVAYGEVQKTW